MLQVIISVFVGLILVDEFNMSFRIKKINRRIGNLKFFRCLPCFTFWTSLIIGVILQSSTYSIIIDSMISFIIARLLDNKNQ